jgi:hypothetical protein
MSDLHLNEAQSTEKQEVEGEKFQFLVGLLRNLRTIDQR